MKGSGHLDWAASRLAVAIERVADALLVEDEPAPGRVESVSIAPAHGVAAPMTDVIIVVIALIATAFGAGERHPPPEKLHTQNATFGQNFCLSRVFGKASSCPFGRLFPVFFSII